jgi:hypothetical protein
MATTLPIALQNNTSSSTVYAYITGQAIDNGNRVFLLSSDGRTPYYPDSPSATGAPLQANVAIPLGPPGSTLTTTIPRIAGGRIWFSISTPLTFLLNPGGTGSAGAALVEPSVTNPSDPNIGIQWDFVEFTFNPQQLYANVTYVDFLSIPVSLTLSNTSGGSQHVSGVPSNGLNTVCAALRAQNAVDGAGWDRLVVPLLAGGGNLRALSPNTGIVTQPGLFNGYWDPYVNAVWTKYSSTSASSTNAKLNIDTQASYGTVSSSVVNDLLTFPNVGTFSRPSSADIFSCSTGPFAVGSNQELLTIVPRLAAGFNRSTLLIDSNQPSASPSQYYHDTITNHYSRICHATALDGRGYAFPYDDVAPANSIDQSGSVFDPNPALLTVIIGGDPPSGVPAGTSGGTGAGSGQGQGTRSAFTPIPAASYTTTGGAAHPVQTEPVSDSDTSAGTSGAGGLDVGYISSGAWLLYPAIDFGSAGASTSQPTQFLARVASGAGSGVSGLVSVVLDSLTNAPVASFSIANTGGWQSWVSVPANVTGGGVAGVHDVYLVFSSGVPNMDFVNVHWWVFETVGNLAVAPVSRVKQSGVRKMLGGVQKVLKGVKGVGKKLSKKSRAAVNGANGTKEAK